MIARRISSIVTLGIFVVCLSLQAANPNVPEGTYAVVPIIQQWGFNPVLVSAVEQQNQQGLILAEAVKRDQQWRESSGTSPFMKSLMENPASQELYRLERTKPYFVEFILTDNIGAIVATTNRTTDYWQGDEDKFVKSYNDGVGGVYVGEVKFDESTQAFLVQVSVPVMSGERAIGSLTVGLNLDVQLISHIAKSNPKFLLTKKERAWLDSHPDIRMGFTADFEPMLIVSEPGGRFSGALVDLLAALHEQSGLEIGIEIGSQAENDERIASGDLDGLLTSSKAGADKNGLLLSDKIGTLSLGIFVRTDSSSSINGWNDIVGKRVARVQERVFLQRRLDSFKGSIDIVDAETPLSAYNLLLENKADVYVGLVMDNYHINKHMLTGIELAYVDSRGGPVGISMRSDWPELQSIINKSLSAIGESNISAIRSRWINLPQKQRPLTFTNSEQEWIAEHPEISLGALYNEPWLIRASDGSYSGITIDIVREIERRTGLVFSLDVAAWPVILQKIQNQDIDGLLAGEAALRAVLLTPTRSPISVKLAVYGRTGTDIVVDSLEKLSGLRIVYYGTAQKRILDPLKDKNELIPVVDAFDGFTRLLEREADIFLGFSFDNYTILRNQIIGVRPIYLDADQRFPITLGIRKDWQPLVGIINKGMDDIGEQRINRLVAKWVNFPGDDKANYLTEKEREWLQGLGAINVSVHRNQPPFEFLDSNGEAAGITTDYINIIADRLGVDVNFVFTDQSNSSTSQPLGEGVDLSLLLEGENKTNSTLSYSQPYLDIPLVLVRNRNESTIQSFSDINDNTLAVVRNSSAYEFVENRYPLVVLHPVETLQEGLLALEAGQVYGLFGNAVAIDYLQRRMGIENLKVSVPTKYSFRPTVAVDKKLDRLIPVINKILSDFTEQEKKLIFDKWVNQTVVEKFDWEKIVFWGSAIGILVFATIISILYWNRRLAYEINERTLAQSAAEAAENKAMMANIAKSTFLANMSHEIRTPMNAILGFSELLHSSKNIVDEDRKSLEIVSNAGNHLLGIIDDILDISKIEAGKMSLASSGVDLKSMLRDMEKMFSISCEEKGLSLSVDNIEVLPDCIVADESKLRQILINLLSNAIKFTEKGGVICRIYYESLSDGCCDINIEVADTGMGISEDEQSKVFKSFEQTQSGLNKKGGTGLGLAISREYARMMGGDITVSSRVASADSGSSGTTFYLRLLVEESQMLSSSCQQSEITVLKQGQGKPKVLIVDDEDANRKLAHKLLTSVGFTVFEAQDGLHAIEKFVELKPDLILMDIRMPVMDGVEAIKSIRKSKQGQDVPIIAVTASAFEEERQSILQHGASDFLRKPFKRNDLLQMIGEHLGLSYERELAPDSNQVQSTETNIFRSSTQGKVLIVDDIAVNRMLLFKIMSAQGYECREATNGEEAMREIQEWQPDITLLDIQMPVMDGYEVLRRVKDLPGASPLIVAVTADDDRAETDKLEALGAAFVRNKPVDLEEIKDLVKRQLAGFVDTLQQQN